MGLAERATKDREILGIDVDQPAIDPTVPGDDAVSQVSLVGQPEIGGPVGDEPVEFNETVFVQQQIEPFPGGELPLLVLLGDPGRPAALLGLGLAAVKIVETIAGACHGASGRIRTSFALKSGTRTRCRAAS